MLAILNDQYELIGRANVATVLALEEPVRVKVNRSLEHDFLHAMAAPTRVGFLPDVTPNLKLEFNTQGDERVCPICEALDSEVYEIDDPLRPEIPADTHANCRCYYVDVETEEPTLE